MIQGSSSMAANARKPLPVGHGRNNDTQPCRRFCQLLYLAFEIDHQHITS
jgi:hypothetical protein